MSYDYSLNSAHAVIAKRKREETEKQAQLAKETEHKRDAAENKQLARDALAEARKGNELAAQGVKIASDSRRLSRWAIVIAVITTIVTVALNCYALWGAK